VLWHDRCHQYLHHKEEREAVDPMNVDTLIKSVLFLTGTTLSVSVAIRGMQRAPLANAAEHGLNGIKAEGKRLAKRR
jgi:hypothetical protein